MPLAACQNPEFQTIFTNHATVPDGNGMGIVTTAGTSNADGSWTEVFDAALITKDCYGMSIWIAAVAAAGIATDCLLDIGIDLADTSNFTELISDLVASCATPAQSSGIPSVMGIHYFFPVFIKAGTQIGARSRVNSGTGRNPRVYIQLYADPLHPEAVKCGSFVDTFGAVPASSSGTTFTPGLASEGTYADISGADVTKEYFYVDFGISVNDATMSFNIMMVDVAVGDGSNKRTLIQNRMWMGNNTECACKLPGFDGWGTFNTGRLYGRGWLNGAVDSNWGMVIYAVGGLHGG